MRSRLALLVAVALPVSVLAAQPRSAAQTLYSLSVQNEVLQTVDPADGEPIAAVGTDDAGDNRGLAMHPISGVLYATEGASQSSPWYLVSIDPADGTESVIGQTGDERIRAVTFDAAGTLWAVTGKQSDNPHSLVTLDLATGAPTLRNAALGTEIHKLAYRTGWDRVYLLGITAMDGVSLRWFRPTDPTTLHDVPLTGATLDDFRPYPGFVYEPYGDRFLTGDDLDWLEVTPDGVVTTLAGFTSDNSFGIAWDAETTAYTTYVFVDGFEIDGVCAWSGAVGGPAC